MWVFNYVGRPRSFSWTENFCNFATYQISFFCGWFSLAKLQNKYKIRVSAHKTYSSNIKIECVWERRTSMFPVLDKNLWALLTRMNLSIKWTLIYTRCGNDFERGGKATAKLKVNKFECWYSLNSQVRLWQYGQYVIILRNLKFHAT